MKIKMTRQRLAADEINFQDTKNKRVFSKTVVTVYENNNNNFFLADTDRHIPIRLGNASYWELP